MLLLTLGFVTRNRGHPSGQHSATRMWERVRIVKQLHGELFLLCFTPLRLMMLERGAGPEMERSREGGAEGRGWWYGCAYPRFLGMRTAALERYSVARYLVQSLFFFSSFLPARIFMYTYERTPSSQMGNRQTQFTLFFSFSRREVTWPGVSYSSVISRARACVCVKPPPKHDGVHMTKREPRTKSVVYVNREEREGVRDIRTDGARLVKLIDPP